MHWPRLPSAATAARAAGRAAPATLIAALVATGLVAGWWAGWWAGTGDAPTPARMSPRATAPQQALQAGQAWPFAPAPDTRSPPEDGTGRTAASAGLSAGPPTGPMTDVPDEPAAHAGAGTDLGPAPEQLSPLRPQSARAFLRQVELAAEPRGGYTVRAVAPGSLYERLGLQAGDWLGGLDTEDSAAVDDGSMVSLIQQATLVLDVRRGGQPLRLTMSLADDPPEAQPDGPR